MTKALNPKIKIFKFIILIIVSIPYAKNGLEYKYFFYIDPYLF